MLGLKKTLFLKTLQLLISFKPFVVFTKGLLILNTIFIIKVLVPYPNNKTVKFDNVYYKNTHLPMVSKLINSPFKGIELNLGLASKTTGKLIPYVAVVHLKFDDIASFQTSIAPHAEVTASHLKITVTYQQNFI